MTQAPAKVGDQFAYVITITNAGTGSSASTLTVNLPAQVTYNGSVVDRGPGCSSSGQTVTCPLDFFPTGLQDTVVIGAKVTATGTLVMTTATSSSPGDTNPTDGNTNVTIQVGSAAAPAPFTPPTLTSPKPSLPRCESQHSRS